ncbi:FecR protein [Planctomycetes bacterium CA13]|uniref:FecR protein n=1 Tax=Novipirellula herctigrandis TaxID=2527986 RepID=A0A5C5ZCP7_9BACT|nr:FecR protein [Planctomycetes bacterium CA13]
MNEARLQRLLEDFQDDALNEAECRELMEWFDEDESRVSAFIDELRVGNTLAALHVMESDRIPLAVKDSLQRGDVAIDIASNVRQRIESRTQTLPPDVERSNPPLRKWAPWWIATVAVAASVALSVVLPRQPDINDGDVVAAVQNARNVQDFSAGDQLRSGQVLKLVDGRIKINFQSGARLAIQAPAELKLLGPNSAQLHHGVATVRVPGEVKGFVLVTPHQRVTDLGTSFGVDVNSTGDTAISVFEGEIELEDHRRLVGGQAVALTATEKSPHEIPYAINQFLDTWRVSFGVEQLIGDVRVASPGERHSPGLARDSDSLLLFPEREDALLKHGYVVDAMEPGTYRRPFRKHTVELTEDVRVDSFLLQYNPVHDDDVPMNQKFQGELHFDRPIVALILQKDLLDSSDAQLALPATDFRKIFRRGINDADVITLSADRRVLHVALNVKNGVDQIRVLVASDNNFDDQ